MGSFLYKAGEAMGNVFSPSAFMPYINSGVQHLGDGFQVVSSGVSNGVHQIATTILSSGAAVYALGARFLQPSEGTFGVLAPAGRVTLLAGGTVAGMQALRELGTAARVKDAASRMLALTRAGLWGVSSAVAVGLSLYTVPADPLAPAQ